MELQDQISYARGSTAQIGSDIKEDSNGSHHKKEMNCHRCEVTGHIAKNCPNKNNMKVNLKYYACYTCGENGHLKKDCTAENKGSGDQVIGHRGNKMGHEAKNSMEKEEPFSKIEKPGFSCGKLGHVARACSDRDILNGKDLSSFSCFRCGEYGHISKQCQSAVRNAGDINTPMSKSAKLSGFAQGLLPKEVVGAMEVKGKLMFALTWIGSEETSMVTAEEANINCASLVFKYFEDRASGKNKN